MGTPQPSIACAGCGPGAGQNRGAGSAGWLMIRQIEAKVLLSHVKQPDTWFGLKYNMNLYRGCQHRCIYCDSRSECYGIDGFDREVLVKANAIDLLRQELARKRVKGTIGLGAMNDSYMPLERELNLTGQALRVIAEFGFTVHLLTKSDLVLRDLDVLQEINSRFAAISFTVTTADDELGKKVEPGAPRVSRRFAAMRVLAGRGIRTGVAMMPILPFIEDNEQNILSIVRLTHEHGGVYIIPWFGMSLRDRQRAHYYKALDELFPGLRAKYEARFGNRYGCPANNAGGLHEVFEEECATLGIATRFQPYRPAVATQPSLI
jgi:DNA repair photolyase